MLEPPFPLDVIYRDDRLIAVNKPAGQMVIPGRGAETAEPLNAQVTRFLGAKAYVVHRIDRGASGLVIFAVDASNHKRLSELFHDHLIKKSYLALVDGWCDRDGVISKPIRQFGSGRMGVGLGGKRSVTRYHPLEICGTTTLLEVATETGRRHQIRVHLYSRNHPIIGDPLYGNNRPVGGAPRLMLHAHRLRIPEPGDGNIDLVAPEPVDWLAVLDSHRDKSDLA